MPGTTHINQQVNGIQTRVHPRHATYRERKCADTTGTVPVTWAGRFQRYNINIFFKQNTREQSYRTALGNCFGFELPKGRLPLKKKVHVSLVITFGTLSFPTISQSLGGASR